MKFSSLFMYYFMVKNESADMEDKTDPSHFRRQNFANVVTSTKAEVMY